MPYRRLSVFHQFYYLYKQNRIAVSSVSLFCLRSLSGWQIYNYTFFFFILVQNWISCLLLGLPKCSECWNSVLKIKPNNSRISSARSVKSLECKSSGVAYLEMFAFISPYLTYTYIFLTQRFLSLYHTRFKAINNCSVTQPLCFHKIQNMVPYVVLKGKYPFLQPSVCSDMPISSTSSLKQQL